MHLPYWFRAAENAVCRSRSTVHQCNHFTSLLWTSEFMQVSPFSSMVMKDFSWFRWRQFWMCIINRFCDAFPRTRNFFWQIVPWFQRSIWFAASWMWCSLRETSEKLLLCVFCACAAHFQEQICIFLSFTYMQVSNSGFGKFQYKSFTSSWEKSERLCLLLFHEWRNP